MSTQPHLCHPAEHLKENEVFPQSENGVKIPYRTFAYRPADDDDHVEILYSGNWEKVARVDFDFPHETEED